MATPEHISTARTAFILTIAFSAAWLIGADTIMDSEPDPKGYQANDLETSVWIAQQRAQEASSEADHAMVVSAR